MEYVISGYISNLSISISTYLLNNRLSNVSNKFWLFMIVMFGRNIVTVAFRRYPNFYKKYALRRLIIVMHISPYKVNTCVIFFNELTFTRTRRVVNKITLLKYHQVHKLIKTYINHTWLFERWIMFATNVKQYVICQLFACISCTLLFHKFTIISSDE